MAPTWKSDTLLVVTIILVHHLDKVDGSVFNFEDKETVKSGKMFKVSTKAPTSTSEYGKNGLTLLFSAHKSTDRQFVAV